MVFLVVETYACTVWDFVLFVLYLILLNVQAGIDYLSFILHSQSSNIMLQCSRAHVCALLSHHAL